MVVVTELIVMMAVTDMVMGGNNWILMVGVGSANTAGGSDDNGVCDDGEGVEMLIVIVGVGCDDTPGDSDGEGTELWIVLEVMIVMMMKTHNYR